MRPQGTLASCRRPDQSHAFNPRHDPATPPALGAPPQAGLRRGRDDPGRGRRRRLHGRPDRDVADRAAGGGPHRAGPAGALAGRGARPAGPGADARHDGGPARQAQPDPHRHRRGHRVHDHLDRCLHRAGHGGLELLRSRRRLRQGDLLGQLVQQQAHRGRRAERDHPPGGRQLPHQDRRSERRRAPRRDLDRPGHRPEHGLHSPGGRERRRGLRRLPRSDRGRLRRHGHEERLRRPGRQLGPDHGRHGDRRQHLEQPVHDGGPGRRDRESSRRR